MPKFSKSSLEKLKSCDERLQKVFNEVVKYYDCTIICGHRGEKEQNDAYANGYSKLKYPKSKHNLIPSKAVDVMPFPINWNDRKKVLHFSGFVMGIAKSLGINLRCGIDFNQDFNFENDSFIDGPHYELVD